MALRMRRRHKMKLAEDVAERVEEVARDGLDRVTDAAAGTVAVATAAIEAATRGKSPRLLRVRRAGIGLLAVLIAAATAAAIYRWWSRRRQDEEFARLNRLPNDPFASPGVPPVPPAPVSDAEPVVSPAPARASMPTPPPSNEPPNDVPDRPQPWGAPAVEPTPAVAPTPAPAVAIETQAERAQRATWNSNQREVPLFVLPLRPSVPFRGASTPVAGRARLPGDTAFR